ncbi:MAG: hypothetical protein WD534_12525, partial [Phycisphaeraceae bacterium]
HRNRRAMSRLGVALTITLIGAVAVPLACVRVAEQANPEGAGQWVGADIAYYGESIEFVPPRELRLDDAEQVATLARFFPKLGNPKRAQDPAGWVAVVVITFHTADGETVEVKANPMPDRPDESYWSEDGHGDYLLRDPAELLAFLDALVHRREAAQVDLSNLPERVVPIPLVAVDNHSEQLGNPWLITLSADPDEERFADVRRVGAAGLDMRRGDAPEAFAAATSVGAAYLEPPNQLIPLRGTILAPLELPVVEHDPHSNEHQFVRQLRRITAQQLLEQIETNHRRVQNQLGIGMPVSAGDNVAMLTPNGALYVMHVLIEGNDDTLALVQPLGRLEIPALTEPQLPLQLGPVVEAMIPPRSRREGPSREVLLDFESGGIHLLPEHLRDDWVTDERARWQWKRRQEVDVKIDVTSAPNSLVSLSAQDAAMCQVDEVRWQTMTAEQVRSHSELAKLQGGVHPFSVRAHELPRTYLFRTREGSWGLLRLVEHMGEAGLRIRYRLVQPGQEMGNLQNEAGWPWAEPLLSALKEGEDDRVTALLGDSGTASELIGYRQTHDLSQVGVAAIYHGADHVLVVSTPVPPRVSSVPGAMDTIRVLRIRKDESWQTRLVEIGDADGTEAMIDRVQRQHGPMEPLPRDAASPSPRAAAERFLQALRERDVAYLVEHVSPAEPVEPERWRAAMERWAEEISQSFDPRDWRLGRHVQQGNLAIVETPLEEEGTADDMFVILHRQPDGRWLVREFDDWGEAGMTHAQRLERFRERAAEQGNEAPATSPAALLPALKAQFAALLDAVEDEDGERAKQLLESTRAGVDRLVTATEGTAAEEGVRSAIGVLEQAQRALEADDLAQARTLLADLEAAGPQLERMVQEATTRASNTAVGDEERQPAFTPAIERVIMQDGQMSFAFIDLDKNQVETPPFALRFTPGVEWQNVTNLRLTPELLRWVREQEIDAVVHIGDGPAGRTFGWRALRMTRAKGEHGPVHLDTFDDWSAEQVVRALAQDGIATRPVSFAFVLEEPTFGQENCPFLTEDGGMGILQVTEFTDEPPGVRLRYKLVQAGTAGDEGGELMDLAEWLRGKAIIEVTFAGPHMDPRKLRDSLNLQVDENDADFRLTPGGGGGVDRAFVRVSMAVTPENVQRLLALQAELEPRGYLLDWDDTQVLSYVGDPEVRAQARELVPEVLEAMQREIEQAVPDTEIDRSDRGLGDLTYRLPADDVAGSVFIHEVTTAGQVVSIRLGYQYHHLPRLGLMIVAPDRQGDEDARDWPLSPEHETIRRVIHDALAPLLELEAEQAQTARPDGELEAEVPTSWRDAESEAMVGAPVGAATERYGPPDRHASAEPVQGKLLVGHYWDLPTPEHPHRVLVVRTEPRGDETIEDAYWATADHASRALHNPPPEADGDDEPAAVADLPLVVDAEGAQAYVTRFIEAVKAGQFGQAREMIVPTAGVRNEMGDFGHFPDLATWRIVRMAVGPQHAVVLTSELADNPIVIELRRDEADEQWVITDLNQWKPQHAQEVFDELSEGLHPIALEAEADALPSPGVPAYEQEARRAAERFVSAVAAGSGNIGRAPIAPDASDGLTFGALERLGQTADLSEAGLAQVQAAEQTAIAITEPFALRERDQQVQLGLSLIKQHDRWLVRDLDMLPSPQAVERFVQDFREHFGVSQHPMFRIAGIADDAGVDLDTGRRQDIFQEWPEEFDVRWDHGDHDGQVLGMHAQQEVRLLALSDAADFEQAIAQAVDRVDELQASPLRAVFDDLPPEAPHGEQARFAAALTSEGRVAVVDQSRIDEGIIYWSLGTIERAGGNGDARFVPHMERTGEREATVQNDDAEAYLATPVM